MRHIRQLLFFILLITLSKESFGINRRQFLERTIALFSSTAVPLEAIDSILSDPEASSILRDIAEIRNVQWNNIRRPNILDPAFIERYIAQLNQLELVTDRGLRIRRLLVGRLSRQLSAIRLFSDQQLINEIEDGITTDKGQEALSQFSQVLIHNLVLIRDLLLPSLIQKLNANAVWNTGGIHVTTEEMIILRDYYLLLSLNLERFDSSDPSYGLLLNMLKDARDWFPRLLRQENHVAPSCRQILSN